MKQPHVDNIFPIRLIAVLFTSACILLSCSVVAQEIPLGTWRTHISFNTVHSITGDAQTMYAATQNGVMIVDRADKNISTLSKLNGLGSTGITDILYHASSGQLLISYEGSQIDVVKDNTIISLDPLRNTPITGSKRINQITLHNNLAYLSSDYGVVVLDMTRAAVKETWRDLGPVGETLKIYASTFKDDSIFLATNNGVIAGNIADNLLDFSNWKRYADGDLNGAVQHITFFNNQVYAAINGQGLYTYASGVWTKEVAADGFTFQFVKASGDNLWLSAENTLYKLTPSQEFTTVSDALITKPLIALEDNGKIWIGDETNGLISNDEGLFKSYLPNGPTQSSFRLAHNGRVVYSVGGGYTSTAQPLNIPGVLNTFEKGVWSNKKTTVANVSDVSTDASSGNTYIASFGNGLEKWDREGNVSVYNNANSPLQASSGNTNLTALEQSAQGLWVANYGVSTSLHLLKDDDTWESFAPGITAARYPTDLAVDLFDNVWMVANPVNGGGLYVYNKDDNTDEYITDAGDNLPNRNVRSIAVDHDGLVWVGTDVGVAYFYSPTDKAFKPVFENRFLLRDDRVNSIAIDGGNRKWMGTTRGVWLFNTTGEQLVYNFTDANSPLLSNNILDIEINPESGEVFFLTDKGLISFRSDATEGRSFDQKIKIFPNPVTRNFSGQIGISGLVTDATVKITDVSGKMIWQTQANGGTATWNVLDYAGRRAASGIYLVFSASQDGAESMVGKIAVVD